ARNTTHQRKSVTLKNKFRTEHLPVTHAVDVAGVFWPTFVVRDGHVFVELKLGRVETRPKVPVHKAHWDHTGREAFSNHHHILDLFGHARTEVWSQHTMRY